MEKNFNKIKCIIKDSGCFDKEWYIKQYLGTTKSSIEPLDDYIQNWKRKDRNPSAHFCNDYYLSQSKNPEEIKNPLAHYIAKGWKQLKNPSYEFNNWWYMVNHMPENMYEEIPLKHFYAIKTKNKKESSTTIYKSKRLSVNQKTKFNKNSIALFKKIPTIKEIQNKAISDILDLQQFDVADMLSEQVALQNPNCIQTKTLRSSCLKMRSKWRDLKANSEQIIALDKYNANAYMDLGRACQRLERYSEAAPALKQAIKLGLNNHETYYLLALTLDKMTDKQAINYYSKAAEELKLEKCKYTVCILHKFHNNWLEAANEFEKNNIRQEIDIKHLKEYALALEKTYQWEQAEKIYNEIAKKCNSTASQYGNLLERLEKFEDATKQYKESIKNIEQDSSIRYRLAFSLFKSGRYQEACEQWLEFISKNTKQFYESQNSNELWSDKASNKYYQTAKKYFNTDPEKSEAKLKLACLHASNYSPKFFIATGTILFKNKKFKEACLYLMEALPFKKAYLNIEKLSIDDTKLIYKEHLETTSIQHTHILYESANGRVVGDNPYYIFKYLLSQNNTEKQVHIWSIANEEKIPKELSNMDNIVFLKEGSYGYLKSLASAKYLINSHSFKPFFLRRAGQKYLMTWHGTPIKKMGIDYKAAQLDGKNISRNILQSTHIIHPNKYTEQKILSCFQVKSIYEGISEITGYPRIDVTLRGSSQKQKNTREKLGINNKLPIVLYAPTFRGEVGTKDGALDGVSETLKALCDDTYNLLYSGHQFYTEKPNAKLLNTTIINNIEINSILNSVDVLITDYSSILFDFLPQKKPIILYPYDLKKYKEERGLYLELNELNLKITHTISDLKKALLQGFNENQWQSVPSDKVLKKFSNTEKGDSTKKVCELFFGEESFQRKRKKEKRKKKILFYMGSFIPIGITTSFLNLMEKINHDEYDITLALDPWTINSYTQRIEKFNELSNKVKLLPRVSYPVADVDEITINNYFQFARGKVSDYARRRLEHMYNNEYFRLYGNAKFDIIIDFNGYDYFWTALFSLKSKKEKSLLWLHNDMLAEAKLKYPSLRTSLSLLNNFDNLVSVSHAISEVNKSKLSDEFNVDKTKFIAVKNFIITEKIIKKSKDPIPDQIKKWAKNDLIIGTAARLSYEKGIDRLINVFYKIKKQFKNLKLIIMGQGPELDKLIKLTNSLHLQNNVLFTGYLSNPYPVMKNLDIFVLASRHEGQGIVLLEALALGINVISTNIPGPNEVLKNHPEFLVESSETGLYDGIYKTLDNLTAKTNMTKTEHIKYNESIYIELSQALTLGNKHDKY